MIGCREYQGRRQKRARGGPGYGVRSVKGRDVYLHRWVWEQINGPIPPGMEILHTCDNPPCFLYAHLRLGTRADNMQDAKAKGRLRQGPGKPFAAGPDARRGEGRRFLPGNNAHGAKPPTQGREL